MESHVNMLICSKNVCLHNKKPSPAVGGRFSQRRLVISMAVLVVPYCGSFTVYRYIAGAARQPTTPIIYPKGDVFNDSVQR